MGKGEGRLSNSDDVEAEFSRMKNSLVTQAHG